MSFGMRILTESFLHMKADLLNLYFQVYYMKHWQYSSYELSALKVVHVLGLVPNRKEESPGQGLRQRCNG